MRATHCVQVVPSQIGRSQVPAPVASLVHNTSRGLAIPLASNRDSHWTNGSVLKLAPTGDPVEALLRRARQVVSNAIDSGWSGPPFDPIALAEILKLPLSPRDDVADARTVPVGKDGLRIEFNPNRPSNRVCYSIAHEIAHSLFPDCHERINRKSVV